MRNSKNCCDDRVGHLGDFMKQRHASCGSKIEAGKASSKDLGACILKKGDAAPNTSGRQGLLENLINDCI